MAYNTITDILDDYDDKPVKKIVLERLIWKK
jgi:hypothetical protein